MGVEMDVIDACLRKNRFQKGKAVTAKPLFILHLRYAFRSSPILSW